MKLLRVLEIDARVYEYVVQAHVVSFVSRQMKAGVDDRTVNGTRLYLSDGRTLDVDAPIEEIVKAMGDPGRTGVP